MFDFRQEKYRKLHSTHVGVQRGVSASTDLGTVGPGQFVFSSSPLASSGNDMQEEGLAGLQVCAMRWHWPTACFAMRFHTGLCEVGCRHTARGAVGCWPAACCAVRRARLPRTTLNCAMVGPGLSRSVLREHSAHASRCWVLALIGFNCFNARAISMTSPDLERFFSFFFPTRELCDVRS